MLLVTDFQLLTLPGPERRVDDMRELSGFLRDDFKDL